MTRPTPEVDTHIPALDGLRALAILAVLALHATSKRLLATGKVLDTAAFDVTRVGWIGVDLFFVLSGFLITGILLETRGRRGYFRSFYARRTVRIFPLYYAALLMIMVVLPAMPGLLSELTHRTVGERWVWTYLTNVRLARTGEWASIPALAVPYWSLSVEEQFYLVWPLIVWLTSPARLGRICICLIVGALALRVGLVMARINDLALYALTPTRLDTLAVGALLAVWARTDSLGRARQLAPAVLAITTIGAVGIAVAVGGAYANPLWETCGFSFLAVGFGALLVWTLVRPPDVITNVLTRPFMRYIGMRSYAIYVLHYPIVRVLEHVRLTRLPLVGGSGLLRQGTNWLLVGAGAILCAEVSWQLWERHWLALKRLVPRPTPPLGYDARVADSGSPCLPKLPL